MIVMGLPGTISAYCGPSRKRVIESVLAFGFCFCLVGFPSWNIAGHCITDSKEGILRVNAPS
jgi:hypothetical protein